MTFSSSTPPHAGMVIARPGSLPPLTVATNLRNPLFHLRRSAAFPRSPAPSALPPWHGLHALRYHDLPSLIAFSSPDMGLVGGTSSARTALIAEVTAMRIAALARCLADCFISALVWFF